MCVIGTPRARKYDKGAYYKPQGHQCYDPGVSNIMLFLPSVKPFHLMLAQNTAVNTINKQQFHVFLQEVLTFPTRAGIFIEFVANPMPNTIASSTPRNLATSFSSSTCLSKVPAEIYKQS